jgi:hypothetical protein
VIDSSGRDHRRISHAGIDRMVYRLARLALLIRAPLAGFWQLANWVRLLPDFLGPAGGCHAYCFPLRCHQLADTPLSSRTAKGLGEAEEAMNLAGRPGWTELLAS